MRPSTPASGCGGPFAWRDRPDFTCFQNQSETAAIAAGVAAELGHLKDTQGKSRWGRCFRCEVARSVNGRWSIVHGQWSTIDYRPSTIDHGPLCWMVPHVFGFSVRFFLRRFGILAPCRVECDPPGVSRIDSKQRDKALQIGAIALGQAGCGYPAGGLAPRIGAGMRDIRTRKSAFRSLYQGNTSSCSW